MMNTLNAVVPYVDCWNQPVCDPETGLWFYGNPHCLMARLIRVAPETTDLDRLQREIEALILDGAIPIVGTRSDADIRAGVVPLRWGCGRVLALGAGFHRDLGEDLRTEPNTSWRGWRYSFDPGVDLAVSRARPEAAYRADHGVEALKRDVQLLSYRLRNQDIVGP